MSSGSSADNHHHHHHTTRSGGHKAAAWREVLLKVKKKSGQIRSGATGTVPSALRSRGQCALESPRSLLRVARTCPQSAARTNGRASGRSVWSNRIPIFGDRDDVAVRLPGYPGSHPGLKKKKKTRFRVRRSRFADRSAGAAEPRRH